MNRRLLLAAGFVMAFGGRVARAAEEQPAAAAVVQPETSSVRAGKTTVTVIDENESVDDVVTRVRAARGRELEKRNQPPGPGAAATTTPQERQTVVKPRGDGSLRAAVREARAGGARPGPIVRERIRDRLNDRKTARPRADQLRRQRAR